MGQPLYPGEKILVPIKQEAGYAPELVSVFWRQKISVALSIFAPQIFHPIPCSQSSMHYPSS